MERTNSIARGKRSLEGDEDQQPERKRPALARFFLSSSFPTLFVVQMVPWLFSCLLFKFRMLCVDPSCCFSFLFFNFILFFPS